jgi:hypothetical protein
MNFPSKTVSNTSKKAPDAPTPSMFWKFGADFHSNEAVRNDATDFVLFTAMGVLCAWPIVSVIVAISRTLNGY